MLLNSALLETRKAGEITLKMGERDEYGSDGALGLKNRSSLLVADMIVSATGFNHQDNDIINILRHVKSFRPLLE